MPPKKVKVVKPKALKCSSVPAKKAKELQREEISKAVVEACKLATAKWIDSQTLHKVTPSNSMSVGDVIDVDQDVDEKQLESSENEEDRPMICCTEYKYE